MLRLAGEGRRALFAALAISLLVHGLLLLPAAKPAGMGAPAAGAGLAAHLRSPVPVPVEPPRQQRPVAVSPNLQEPLRQRQPKPVQRVKPEPIETPPRQALAHSGAEVAPAWGSQNTAPAGVDQALLAYRYALARRLRIVASEANAPAARVHRELVLTLRLLRGMAAPEVALSRSSGDPGVDRQAQVALVEAVRTTLLPARLLDEGFLTTVQLELPPKDEAAR